MTEISFFFPMRIFQSSILLYLKSDVISRKRMGVGLSLTDENKRGRVEICSVQKVKPENKMAPIPLRSQVVRARRGGSLIHHGSQAEPHLCLAKGLALNLEIKQPAVPVCTGISDTVRNLICVTAETHLEAKQTVCWGRDDF